MKGELLFKGQRILSHRLNREIEETQSLTFNPLPKGEEIGGKNEGADFCSSSGGFPAAELQDGGLEAAAP